MGGIGFHRQQRTYFARRGPSPDRRTKRVRRVRRYQPRPNQRAIAFDHSNGRTLAAYRYEWHHDQQCRERHGQCRRARFARAIVVPDRWQPVRRGICFPITRHIFCRPVRFLAWHRGRRKPGDVLTLYGIGFGSVTPPIAAGQIVGQANQLAQPVQIYVRPDAGASDVSGSYAGVGGLVSIRYRGAAGSRQSSDAADVQLGRCGRDPDAVHRRSAGVLAVGFQLCNVTLRIEACLSEGHSSKLLAAIMIGEKEHQECL